MIRVANRAVVDAPHRRGVRRADPRRRRRRSCAPPTPPMASSTTSRRFAHHPALAAGRRVDTPDGPVAIAAPPVMTSEGPRARPGAGDRRALRGDPRGIRRSRAASRRSAVAAAAKRGRSDRPIGVQAAPGLIAPPSVGSMMIRGVGSARHDRINGVTRSRQRSGWRPGLGEWWRRQAGLLLAPPARPRAPCAGSRRRARGSPSGTAPPPWPSRRSGRRAAFRNRAA